MVKQLITGIECRYAKAFVTIIVFSAFRQEVGQVCAVYPDAEVRHKMVCLIGITSAWLGPRIPKFFSEARSIGSISAIDFPAGTMSPSTSLKWRRDRSAYVPLTEILSNCFKAALGLFGFRERASFASS